LTGVTLAIGTFLSSLVAGFSSDSPTVNSGTNDAVDWVFEATNQLRSWIWETNTFDAQICHLWKTFEIPEGTQVMSASLRLSVDNNFILYLDGQEIGQGSNWRTVTKFDPTPLLQQPGRHVLAVDAYNDKEEAGLILGLEITLTNGSVQEVFSDDTWWVVPNSLKKWTLRQTPLPDWHHAKVVADTHDHPREVWPLGLAFGPPLHLVVVYFWQRGWFQLTLLVICVLALLISARLMIRLSAQSAAQAFMNRERARIARDIHDEFGAQLTLLVLRAEVAQRGELLNSSAQIKFNQLGEQARQLSNGLDEVVWAVNSQRDTLRDFVSYVCKYARVYLEATPIRCRLDVAEEIRAASFDLPVRRNLFLAVKEALNNAAKYSAATELFLRIHCRDQKLVVEVEDNGQGFDPATASADRNGLANMTQRMTEIGGHFELISGPGRGCRVVFTVPLSPGSRRLRLPWRDHSPGSDAS
jgi:signal transduction histidine kinase